MLDNLEEVLITSDVGVDTTLKIISRIEDRVARDKYVTTSELTAILREEIASCLQKIIRKTWSRLRFRKTSRMSSWS